MFKDLHCLGGERERERREREGRREGRWGIKTEKEGVNESELVHEPREMQYFCLTLADTDLRE